MKVRRATIGRTSATAGRALITRFGRRDRRPVSPAPAVELPAAPAEPAPPSDTVLVVDDCAAMRHLVRRALRQAGVHDTAVVEAADGQSALSRLDAVTPAVVLVDQSLPDMSGVTLLAAVGHRVPAATRVLLTSDRSRSTLLQARAAGSGVLAKPFTVDDLVRLLAGEVPDVASALAAGALVPADARPMVPTAAQVQAVLQDLLDRAVEVEPGSPVLPRPGRGVTCAAYVDARLRTTAALAADRPLSLALVAALELDPDRSPEHAQRGLGPSARANLQEIAEIAVGLLVPPAGPSLRLFELHLPGELPARLTATALAALRSRLDVTVTLEGYGGGGLSLVVPSGG